MLNTTQFNGFGSGSSRFVISAPGSPVVHFKTDNLTEGTMSSWANSGSGGSAYDATLTAGSSPVVSFGQGQAGYPGVTFDSSTYFSFSSKTIQSIGYPVLWGAVSENYAFLGGRNDGSSTGQATYMATATSIGYKDIDGSGTVSAGFNASSFHSFINARTGASAYDIYGDGALKVNRTTVSGMELRYINAYYNLSFIEIGSGGTFLEIIIYDGSSGVTVGDLHTYFKKKFAI